MQERKHNGQLFQLFVLTGVSLDHIVHIKKQPARMIYTLPDSNDYLDVYKYDMEAREATVQAAREIVQRDFEIVACHVAVENRDSASRYVDRKYDHELVICAVCDTPEEHALLTLALGNKRV